MKLTTHLHLVQRLTIVELYLHSPTYLHGIIKCRGNLTFHVRDVRTNSCGSSCRISVTVPPPRFLKKTGNLRQILEEIPSIKFHENPLCGCKMLHAERHGEPHESIYGTVRWGWPQNGPITTTLAGAHSRNTAGFPKPGVSRRQGRLFSTEK
jgi:hypothetical protein